MTKDEKVNFDFSHYSNFHKFHDIICFLPRLDIVVSFNGMDSISLSIYDSRVIRKQHMEPHSPMVDIPCK